jgi:hypothetical protein
MINVMKYIRNFVFVMLCLQSPCAMTIDQRLPLLPQPLTQSHLPMVPELSCDKGVATSINCKFMSPLLNRLSQIDLSGCKSFMVGKVRSNPTLSCIAAGGILLFTVLYIAKKSMTEAQWVKFKDTFASTTKRLGDDLYGRLPKKAQYFFSALKAILDIIDDMGLAGTMINYVQTQTPNCAFSIMLAGGGYVAGWPGTGYISAGFNTAYGMFRCIEDRLMTEMKRMERGLKGEMTQNQLKTNENFEKIHTKVDEIDENIKNIKNTMALNHGESKQSFISAQEGLNLLEQEIKKELTVLGKNVIEAEQKSAKTITDKIDAAELAWKQGLKTNLESFSNQLTAKMDELNATAEKDKFEQSRLLLLRLEEFEENLLDQNEKIKYLSNGQDKIIKGQENIQEQITKIGIQGAQDMQVLLHAINNQNKRIEGSDQFRAVQ